MMTNDTNNWQNLEPPLQEVDAQLHKALRGPAAPEDLAERIFEATADQAMAGPLSETLREAMPVEPPIGLAERIAAAGPPAAQRRRWAPARWASGFAAAAAIVLAVGIGFYMTSTSDDSVLLVEGPNEPATTFGMESDFETLEWALVGDDDIRQQVSDLAADLADLDSYATMQTDAEIEEELTRQLYYYELAAAPF